MAVACNVPCAMAAAQPSLLNSASFHRSRPSVLCSARLDNCNQSSSFRGPFKDVHVRSSQRSRSVVTEVSSVTGSSNDDVFDADAVAEKSSGGPRAKFMAKRSETYELEELERPLADYMALPASQYSVLDAERIERIDDTTFKCYAHRFKFFNFEVGPVLLVRVEEQPDGCCIRLLSCTLEGSPIVVAQNQKFSAGMVNRVSWRVSEKSPTARQLVSDTTLEVTVDIPYPFRAIPVSAIEGSGNKVMSQILKVMLPRFLSQLGKDYNAWASGDSSRKPVGTGEL